VTGNIVLWEVSGNTARNSSVP